VVYRKELLETLRDRRTLMAMVIVPIILYPALMLVLVEALRKETGRRQSERYSIVVPDEAHRDWVIKVMQREEAEQAKDSSEDEAATSQPTLGSAEDLMGGFRAGLRSDQLDIHIANSGQSLWDLVAGQVFHVGILIEPPPDTRHLDDDTNRVVQFIFRDTDPRSEFIYHQLTRILGDEADRIIKSRVVRATGSEASLSPLLANSLSTSSSSQQYAKILAMIVPFLLVTMTVTGAMYPAIDLTAGERERGTLETLAVSPVPVGQIVAGKFFVIVTIAMISTALNLASMSAMIYFTKLDKVVASAGSMRPADIQAVERQIESRPDSGEKRSQKDYLERRRELEQQAAAKVSFVTRAAPVVLLAMVPFAVLAGGVMLAVCSFARTFKEAQNYMMPVMMAAIIPAMVVSYMPTIRLEGAILVFPVANIVALIREMFLGNYLPTALFVSLASTCLYAAAAVVLATKLYGHEAVLFSDVGSYRVLLSRRMFKPGSLPWPALSLLTVAILFPIYFYTQSYLVDARATAERVREVLGLTQVLLLAGLPLLVAWYVRLDFRATYSLRAASGAAWTGALLIGISIVPVAALVSDWMTHIWSGFQASDELFRRQEALLTEGPLWAILLVFAAAPAVCEELLFRGFLMAGLKTRLAPWMTIVAVGCVFGVFHIYIEKIAVVSLLGMLLAYICLRTGSIFPAMLVHMANNGLALAMTRFERIQEFFGIAENGAPKAGHAAIFAVCFLVGLVLIRSSNRDQ